MATADEYAAWIVKNSDKKGTPDFETVAKAYAQAKAEESSAAPEAPKGYLQQTLENIPGSAMRFGEGIAKTIAHPLDAAQGVADLAVGAVGKLVPASWKESLNKLNPPGVAGNVARADQMADSVGQFYKQRYGAASNIAETVKTDPVGSAADLATVLSGGAGIAKAAGAPGVGAALSTASKYTNPLSVVAPVAKGIGAAGKYALGLTTGVGPENIAQAAKAGVAGNADFLANLSGEASMADVLTQARDGLRNMRETRSGLYASNIAETAADKTRLNFAPIDKALADVVESMRYEGKWKIGGDQISKIKEIEKVVQQWRVDSTAHTPMGLDALKQRLDAIYPDSPMQSQVQRAVSTVRNAVKNTIVDQSPKYAETMAQYEKALSTEKEIERALSLGNKASQDTALRKLQSLSRNNVNTNYGNRLDLARTLEGEGGVSLMPSIAGQAMNSWTARGLAGQAENLGTIGLATMHNPMIAAALPFQSPKAVGASLYGAGRLAGAAGRGLGMAGITADRARMAGLLASRLPIDEQTDW